MLVNFHEKFRFRKIYCDIYFQRIEIISIPRNLENGKGFVFTKTNGIIEFMTKLSINNDTVPYLTVSFKYLWKDIIICLWFVFMV